MIRRHAILPSAAAAALIGFLFLYPGESSPGYQKKLDPSAWGATHIGQGFPEFVRGDECLFCHRNDIGPAWQRNIHGKTVRTRESAPDLVETLLSRAPESPFRREVQFFLGSRRRVRFLKKAGYGKFAISGAQAVLSPDGKLESWVEPEGPVWDEAKFGERCTGCHSTAVDTATRAFQSFGLDCLTCHGDAPLDHPNDTSKVWLSKKRRKEGRAITSICAQCHLRGGRSRSSGLPYANTFVAGDNLFKDYEADFSEADNPRLNPGDRHVYRNVRDIVVLGEGSPTCIDCHQVHAQSSARHRLALRASICLDCHNPEGPMKVVKSYTVTSPVCEY